MSLNDDCLHLIIEELKGIRSRDCYPSYMPPLKTFSRANKRLRILCLPYIISAASQHILIETRGRYLESHLKTLRNSSWIGMHARYVKHISPTTSFLTVPPGL